MIVGGGIVTLLKKTLGEACGAGNAGGVLERSFASVIWGRGVAVDGGRPKSAAEEGKGAERNGGLVGGLEDWRKLGPEPPCSWVVE